MSGGLSPSQPGILRTQHNAGFFSCCTVRLINIIDYFNTHKFLPYRVDSSAQFYFYKDNPREDLTATFFADESLFGNIKYTKEIKIISTDDSVHFPDYRTVNYDDLGPFVRKYFSPSPLIQKKIAAYEDKYRLDYENTCLVYYRGNDKITEVHCPPYDVIINKTRKFKEEHPQVKFLCQSDELEFIEYFKKHFPGTIVISEIKPIRKAVVNPSFILPSSERKAFAANFLALAHFFAKIKYVITTTHNTAFWICLFRGHSRDVYQHLHANQPTRQCPENNYWFV